MKKSAVRQDHTAEIPPSCVRVVLINCNSAGNVGFQGICVKCAKLIMITLFVLVIGVNVGDVRRDPVGNLLANQQGKGGSCERACVLVVARYLLIKIGV